MNYIYGLFTLRKNPNFCDSCTHTGTVLFCSDTITKNNLQYFISLKHNLNGNIFTLSINCANQAKNLEKRFRTQTALENYLKVEFPEFKGCS